MPEPQTHTDVPDGWEVVAHAPAPPPPSAGHDFKVFGVNVHVPAEEKPRADSNMVGWGLSGSGIAPEDALAGGMAVKGIVSAAKAGGALAGAKAAVTQATPVVKYEMTKALLQHMGVPAAIAIPTAMMISGYKRGAATAEAGAGRTADVAPAGVDRYMPNASGYVAPAPSEAVMAPEAVARPGTTPAPVASAAPSGPQSAPAPPATAAPTAAPVSLTQEEWQALQGLVSKGYPKEQVLQAIVAKRAGAPVASAPAAAAAPPPAEAPPAPAGAATPAPSAKPKLTAAEVKEVQRLRTLGKSPAEIEHLIEAQRLFQQRFGLASPEATRQAVSQRNESGRWADEP